MKVINKYRQLGERPIIKNHHQLLLAFLLPAYTADQEK
jgi:hypothetical protein